MTLNSRGVSFAQLPDSANETFRIVNQLQEVDSPELLTVQNSNSQLPKQIVSGMVSPKSWNTDTRQSKEIFDSTPLAELEKTLSATMQVKVKVDSHKYNKI